jgi:hypothetical protein
VGSAATKCLDPDLSTAQLAGSLLLQPDMFSVAQCSSRGKAVAEAAAGALLSQLPNQQRAVLQALPDAAGEHTCFFVKVLSGCRVMLWQQWEWRVSDINQSTCLSRECSWMQLADVPSSQLQTYICKSKLMHTYLAIAP